MPMNNSMQAVPPRRTPVSPRKRPVSPRKKQRPSLSLMPNTRRSSRLAISNLNNTNSDKKAPFQSFSGLCLDDLFDKEEEEDHSDEFLDDSKSKKMCSEWQVSADTVVGGTKEEVEFNTNLASLFGSLTDLLANKRAFDKKECSTLQQDMERLKKMRCQLTMSAECKSDASSFPQARLHSPTARAHKQLALGQQHESVANVMECALEGWQGDVAHLQQARGRREEEVFEEQKVVTPHSRSRGIESGREPVTSRSRSPTRRSEGNRRSLKSPSRRLRKSSEDNDNSGKPRQSGSAGRRETSAERRHRRSKASGSKATEHSSPVRSSPKWASPRRTVTPLPGELSSLMLSARHPSKQRDPGVSSYHSQSPRKRSGLAVTLQTTLSRKGDSMSSLGVSNHTSRSMPVSLSPRKSTRTSGQGYGLAAALHTTSSRKGDSMSTLGVSSHTNRSMPVSLSPRKSSRSSGQSDSIRSLITPRRLLTGGSSPVKSIKSPRNDPLGESESIRAVQLHGTPRRSTGKGSTGCISAKPEQSPFSSQHLARLHGRSGVADSPNPLSSRSSRGARPRAQSQTPRTTLSRSLDMFSSCDDLKLAPSVYSSTEKEDSAPRQPSRGGSTDGSGGRRISGNRARSVAPGAERRSRSSSRGCSTIATSGISSSRRRSRSVAPDTGSSRVRSNSVTPDGKNGPGRSHLDLFTRSENRFAGRPSLSSIVYVD